jgi:hypothetical protein
MIKPFGFRINRHCKSRLAKKYLKEMDINDTLNRFNLFHKYPIDGLITACTGLNMQPEKAEPLYIYFGRKSKVLFDIQLYNRFESCSFRHCSVDKPKTYQQCLEYIDHIKTHYKDDDPWGFKSRYEKIVLNEDGTINHNSEEEN